MLKESHSRRACEAASYDHTSILSSSSPSAHPSRTLYTCGVCACALATGIFKVTSSSSVESMLTTGTRSSRAITRLPQWNDRSLARLSSAGQPPQLLPSPKRQLHASLSEAHVSPSFSMTWLGLMALSVPLVVVVYVHRLVGNCLDVSRQPVPIPIPIGSYTQHSSGLTVDVVQSTPNRQVSLIAGPKTRHLRFVVLALFERFSEKGVRVIMLAQEEARRSSHNHVGTEQMLLGIVGEGTGLAARMLKSYGLDLKTARREVNAIVGEGQDQVGVEIPFTPRAKKVLDGSQQQARNLQHNYIGTEHLLLALLEEESGTAARVFETLKIDRLKVAKEMLQLITDGTNISPEAESTGSSAAAPQRVREKEEEPSTLAQFSVNLTQRAKDGLLDPVIGRDEELERVLQILGRRTKNNPCLIGEPGVGKTAIAEGLAQLVATGDVPENLVGKQVTQLDLSLLVAGTKFRGEFEERLKKILEEVKTNNNIILVIDEVHTLVGAGAAEGAIDAANIMKPGLARGEYQLIGATTIAEYRKYIEKDAALERRFQPTMVPEPSPEQAVQILFGLRSKYEEHHKLKYSDAAVEAAVRLSVQYINDRFLPDKAIDALDEAGSCRRLAISRARAAAPTQRLEQEVRRLEEEKRAALAQHDFDRAAILRGQLEVAEEEMVTARQTAPLSGLAVESDSSELIVTEADVASVVARWSGVPVEKLSSSESEALLGLEGRLHGQVIGQDEAVSGVTRALRRARVGMKDPNRPIASLFFLGPTGVGKTQLAKALAKLYFGSEASMMRLDMSEFMERHTVSKLIGSPPGYVGFNEGGQLTELVRKKPYSLLLFDEIEKAHPDVFNMMLQILEDGRLTDSHGRTVSFKNCLVIMTSNVGSQIISRGGGRLGFQTSPVSEEEQTYATMKTAVQEAMKGAFKPEFLNRLDEIVVFRQLTKPQIGQVAEILIAEVAARLQAQEVTLHVAPAFKAKLIENGWNPAYGARPLRRAINTMLEDALSDCLLRGDVKAGDSITVDVDMDGRVVVLGPRGVIHRQETPLVPAGIV